MFPFVRTCSPGVSLLGIEAVVSTHLTIFFPAECNIATIEIVKKFRDEMQVDDKRLQRVYEVQSRVAKLSAHDLLFDYLYLPSE